MRRIIVILIVILAGVRASIAQSGRPITAQTAAGVVPSGLYGPGRAGSAVFSPNGKLLAVASSSGVRLFEVGAIGAGDTLDGDPFPATGVSFSPDGAVLVASSLGYNVRKFDPFSGAKVADLYPLLGGSPGSAAYDPLGRFYAISGGEVISIFDAATDEPVRDLTGHAGRVLAMTYSADGMWLASASSDGSVKVWNAADGTEALTLLGHDAPVGSVGFSDDGDRLITGSDDGSVRVWDRETGAELLVLVEGEPGSAAGAFSPDGHTTAVGGSDGRVLLVDAQTGAQIAEIGQHDGPLLNMAFNADGSLLASVSRERVTLYDVRTLQEIGRIAYVPAIAAIALSPDGMLLAAGEPSGHIRLYDTLTGKESANFALGLPPLRDLAFSADGSTVLAATADSRLGVRRVDGTTSSVEYDAGQSITALAVHPVNPVINAALADGSLYWWDAVSGSQTGAVNTHPAPVTAVAFSPDGQWMASADASGAVFVWSVETGEWDHLLEGADAGIVSIAFSADGRRLATGQQNGFVRIWRIGQGEAPELTLEPPDGRVVGAVAWSPDGSVLAVGLSDGELALYNTVTGERIASSWGHIGMLTGLAFSPDGTTLYSSADDGLLVVWRTL
ncbi:MAG: WD40 repeat domain-containing protein [Phototrophicaceae bacterium]|nr:hypothetical protein [Anaerolineae bacterium]